MRFNLDNYETVEQRLAKFWEKYPNGQIFTTVHYYDENRVVFRAELYKDITDPRPVATGHAEEVRDASPVNRTSHVENAETSAIGRALANYVFQSKTAPRPSREEMAKVARAEQPKQGADLVAKFREACTAKGIDPQDVAKAAGVNFGELTEADMPKLRDAFKKMTAEKPVAKQVEQAEAFIEQVKEAFPDAAVVAETPQIKDPDAPASQPQIAKIRAMLNGQGFGPMNEKVEACAEIVNRPIKKMEQLTKGEASVIINSLESRTK
jgi:hypothetical protein